MLTGHKWSEACKIFEHMVDHGCRPDCSTYSAVLSALSHGGPWASALKRFQEMQHQSIRPDAVAFNALLETLWQSGVARAQSKAAHLWELAVRRGLIRYFLCDPCGLLYAVCHI